MNIENGLMFFFSGSGTLNGLILAAYFLFFKKIKNFISFLLGLLLLILSIRIGKSVFIYYYPYLPDIYRQIGLSVCFFIGPTFYYLIRAINENITEIPAYWKRNFGFQLIAILLTGIIFPYQKYPEIWNNHVVYFVYLQWLLYTVATGFSIKNIVLKIRNQQEELNVTEQFLILLFLGNTIILLNYLLSILDVFHGFCISGPLAFTFFLYISLVFVINREKMANAVFAVQDKYAHKKIGDEQATALVKRLEQLLQVQELYKDPNLKLNDLSKKINISGHQLSQLLNDNLGKSFSTYINEYRINEACKMIIEQPNLTLEAIGYEVGFNSKSTFYTTFKKLKQTTPMIYKANTEKSISS
ncbi:AraC family transcriptional regulator [Emticicia sp. C21]|uniref:helix-turn-helix domain-containing protein n=1 Tax=Emticicia sp. C21 TaxID=2302915 RepID=UPI000E34C27F|nr:helix-turn-helix domain-containing protein [Emticicia sp. C21]RFS15752.1 AraC family transcriptional regulator [Emticicia sp. C21]